jgi:hypothetical protein
LVLLAGGSTTWAIGTPIRLWVPLGRGSVSMTLYRTTMMNREIIIVVHSVRCVLIESYICEIPDLVRACCIGEAHECIYSWNDTMLPSTLLSLIASAIKLLIYSWLSHWSCNRFYISKVRLLI